MEKQRYRLGDGLPRETLAEQKIQNEILNATLHIVAVPCSIGQYADYFHWDLHEVFTLRTFARSRDMKRYRRPAKFRRF